MRYNPVLSGSSSPTYGCRTLSKTVLENKFTSQCQPCLEGGITGSRARQTMGTLETRNLLNVKTNNSSEHQKHKDLVFCRMSFGYVGDMENVQGVVLAGVGAALSGLLCMMSDAMKSFPEQCVFAILLSIVQGLFIH